MEGRTDMKILKRNKAITKMKSETVREKEERERQRERSRE